MVTCRGICSSVFLVLIFTSCIVMWILHSLYFVLDYLDHSSQEFVSKVPESILQMPSVIICNRQPFSIDGVNSVNDNFDTDVVLRYLRDWLNPTWFETADYPRNTLSNTTSTQISNLMNQYLPQSSRRQLIQQMQYQCQSVINSCSYKGQSMGGYQCCQSVSTFLPTLSGLCWTYNAYNLTQIGVDVTYQFSITFQIPRNSFTTQTNSFYPGIEIYMRESADDVIRLASDFITPITLRNQQGHRLKMQKQRKADIRRSVCGSTMTSALSADSDQRTSNRSNLLMCNMLVAIRYCQCHPLLAELLTYDTNSMKYFSSMVNATPVCNLDQYSNCARRYLDYARPSMTDEPISLDLPGSQELTSCRSLNHYPCVRTSYEGIIDKYSLPNEYNQTSDFVSLFTLEYGSMKTVEILVDNRPNLYQLLSYCGYNAALWFTVGYVFWLMFSNSRDMLCYGKRISPAPSPIMKQAPTAKVSQAEPPPPVLQRPPTSPPLRRQGPVSGGISSASGNSVGTMVDPELRLEELRH